MRQVYAGLLATTAAILVAACGGDGGDGLTDCIVIDANAFFDDMIPLSELDVGDVTFRYDPPVPADAVVVSVGSGADHREVAMTTAMPTSVLHPAYQTAMQRCDQYGRMDGGESLQTWVANADSELSLRIEFDAGTLTVVEETRDR